MTHLDYTFQPIARQVVGRFDLLVWDYATDMRALHAAREAGAVITAQRREPDGTFVLLAKLAKERPAVVEKRSMTAGAFR